MSQERTTEEFRAAVAPHCETSELVEALCVHFLLLQKWASRINLTSVTDPVAAAGLHYADSLLFAGHFSPEAEDTVLDIGSGAGFPGIVLALARPKLRVYLVEPVRKRASFLRVALAELKRDDVFVIDSRLDAKTLPPAHANAIVSRATIPPLQLLPLASGWLAPRGRVIVTSGSGAPSIEAFGAASERLRHVLRREHRLPGGQIRYLDELHLVDGSDAGR